MKKYILFGTIIKVHGLKGDFIVECDFEEPQQFQAKLHIENEQGIVNFPAKFTGNLKGDRIIMQCTEVKTLDDVKKLVHKKLFVLRQDLPPLEKGYYACDLIGLNVTDAQNGQLLGTVMDLVDFGSGTNLEIKNLQEKLEYYVYDDTVNVDLESGVIKIKLPEYV